MIFPPILPLGTVVEVRNGPYRCHQPLRSVCDRRLHEILPQPHEVALISRRFVSKRTAFFGNTYCLSNFRELARARLSQPNRMIGEKLGPGRHEKKFRMREFDAGHEGYPHK